MPVTDRPMRDIADAAHTYLQQFALKQKRLFEGDYNMENSGQTFDMSAQLDKL
jgi:hypothetical protein